MTARIAGSRVQSRERLGQSRWAVERSLAWIADGVAVPLLAGALICPRYLSHAGVTAPAATECVGQCVGVRMGGAADPTETEGEVSIP